MKISQKERQIRLEKIKNTAKILFMKASYHEITIEKIIRACHIAKGTFFNYFESKDHLALTLIGESSLAIYRSFEKEIQNQESIPMTTLVELLLKTSIQKYKNMEHLVYASMSFVLNPKTKSFKLQSAYKRCFITFVENFYEASTSSEDAHIKSEILWHLFLSILRQWALEQQVRKFYVQNFVKEILRTLDPALGGTCNIKKALCRLESIDWNFVFNPKHNKGVKHAY